MLAFFFSFLNLSTTAHEKDRKVMALATLLEDEKGIEMSITKL